jgi:hypothetical protein
MAKARDRFEAVTRGRRYRLISKAAIDPEATRSARGRVMSEYVATEYEDTRPVPGEPGNADVASAKDKAMQPAQAGRQPLQQSPACERKR